MTAILLVAICLIPAPEPVDTLVEMAQLDSVYDNDGHENFCQQIWWRMEGDGLHVLAWRMSTDNRFVPQRIPGGWQQVFIDPKDGTLRRVRSRTWVRTWQQRDVELLDREAWPVEQRREMGGHK